MTVGRTQDVGWQIGVSRTLPAPLERVWDLLIGEPVLWLGPGVVLPTEVGGTWAADDGTTGELRSRHEHDRVRLTWRPPHWAHDSTAQVALTPAPGGTTVRFHQERLADADERSAQREHWTAALDRLAAAL